MPPIRPDIGARVSSANLRYQSLIEQEINELRNSRPTLAGRVGALSWVEDGMGGEPEYIAARALVLLAKAGHLPSLLEQDWVIEGKNYAALESLRSLRLEDKARFSRIMSHPRVSDGIDEQEAKLIAVLSAGPNPDLYEELLDPARATLEELTFNLPLAGETEISIIRTGPRTDHAINSLQQALHSIEQFMGFPFPRRQVIFFFDDDLEVRGSYWSTHVRIRANEEFKTERSLRTLLGHEAGHYYWNSSSPWVNEGAAHIMGAVSDDTLPGPLISVSCALGATIEEVEYLDCISGSREGAHPCYYSLGERLFRDLFHNVDDTAFRLAFRRLYLDTTFDFSTKCAPDPTDVCRVREAFTTYAPEDMSPVVDTIISRWHDIPEMRDLAWIEGTSVDREIAAIDGRIEDSYLSHLLSYSPISEVIVGPNRNPLVVLNLEYSYRHSEDLEYLPIYVYLYHDDGSGSGIRRMVADLDVLPCPPRPCGDITP